MKKLHALLIMLLCLTSISVFAQQKTNAVFEPAKAYKKHYDALYVLNEADDKKIRGLLRNINNVLSDPRLKSKLHIEVIAFSDGVEMYKKANDYQEILIALKDKGVVFAQCEKTMQERKIEKNELFDFVNYVPSGNGEIILRQYEGWAIVHP
ncbi:TPA: DsrE family protein [Elizabethkingia anophelis]|nr:DsrE family protein [Elizabethkingia anophelis]HBN6707247.1 DsrE family protein [Elizabethkingia anophelis]HBN6711281.1 DsrE family protein [Elizabethkingia anophelis]HBN6714067.1 DsrE family protein [Elizabethkingia anophelis]HBN6719605.1 DsrE family protein [Elizabethkingia anophelis]